MKITDLTKEYSNLPNLYFSGIDIGTAFKGEIENRSGKFLKIEENEVLQISSEKNNIRLHMVHPTDIVKEFEKLDIEIIIRRKVS